MFVLFTGTARAQDEARDCADFSTQEEAQEYYNDHRDDDPNNPDPFELDTDNDGTACEGLPPAQAAGATATPAATPGSNELPQNGAETGVIALSGLSLLEAGYGLTLASKRLGIRRRSIPLYLMRRMINAAERGGDRVEIADDVYLVHASALKPRDVEAEIEIEQPYLDDDDREDAVAFDDEFIEIELAEEELTDEAGDEIEVEEPKPSPTRAVAPSVYAALARPGILPQRDR